VFFILLGKAARVLSAVPLPPLRLVGVHELSC
jgi:hypothetical protein